MSAHGYGGESVLSTLTAKILLALTLAIARMDFGVEMTIIPALVCQASIFINYEFSCKCRIYLNFF